MATLATLQSERRCHPEGSLPSSFQTHADLNRVSSQKGTSIVKKQKERALGLPGKLPAPNNSRDFLLRFGSGSPLPRLMPDVTAIYGRGSLSEDAAKRIDGCQAQT